MIRRASISLWRAVVPTVLVTVWLAGQAGAVSAAPTGPVGSAQPIRTEQVRVATLPPVSGIRVRLDGNEGITDAAGVVTLLRDRYADVPPSEIEVLDAVVAIDKRTRARVARVFGPGGVRPTIAFDMDYTVGFTLDPGDAADTEIADLGTLAVRSSVGEVKELQPEDVEWFHGQRVVQLNGELEVKDLYWTLQSLDFHGSNLVNRSQQRFEPSKTTSVAVDLLFFTATFRARDALFFHPQGDRIELTYPDGFTRDVPLDNAGRATVGGLPRGEYQVKVIGGGPGMSQPVAITRAQDIDFKVLSWFDIGVGTGSGVLFAVGLLVIGEVSLRRRHRPRCVLPTPVARPALMRPARPAGVVPVAVAHSDRPRRVRLRVATSPAAAPKDRPDGGRNE